jgi:regulator of sigma D
MQTDVQQRGMKMQQQLGNVTSIAEARQLLVDYLDASITGTDQVLDQLEAAGNPAVENGNEIGR